MLRKTYTPILRLLTLCLMVHPLLLVSQTYVNKEWSQTTGLPGNIDWSASAVDPQGNIIVVGNTLVAPGDPDVLISKFNRDGNLLWQQQYHGNTDGEDYGTAVAIDHLGNCYVAATVSNEGAAFDVAVLKYDPEGVLAWHAEWNGAANLYDVPSSIAVDATGNIYVAGTTYSSAMNPNYLLLKLNSNGAFQWASTYDYAGFPDVATGVSFDPMMDPVVTGGRTMPAPTRGSAPTPIDQRNRGCSPREVAGVAGVDNA
ncbi:MAG TPA: SBBP repeat-containing protein, partial [Flavobacteriales bacterium]|nr:SBBP repeat-containing protein [Flavobacteriales bacterium]